MLVSFRHRLVVLAVPRCASTAIHAALAPRMDLVISGPPAARHMTLRRYRRWLAALVEETAGAPVETACVLREPLDWLGSWWRYRGRDGLRDPARSTAGLDFADFVAAHLADRPGPAQVGRQARFVADGSGAAAVDRVFAFERLEGFADWLGARTGAAVRLDRLNAAPRGTGPAALPAALRAEAEAVLAADYALWRGACR